MKRIKLSCDELMDTIVVADGSGSMGARINRTNITALHVGSQCTCYLFCVVTNEHDTNC